MEDDSLERQDKGMSFYCVCSRDYDVIEPVVTDWTGGKKLFFVVASSRRSRMHMTCYKAASYGG